MLFKDVCIEAISYLLPESRVKTCEIEQYLAPCYKTLNLADGILETLTGVTERRLWPSDLAPSKVASESGLSALRSSDRSPQDIDLLIYSGVCRDFIEPASAHLVHHRLKLAAHCMTFDLSNACLGFLNGMILSAHMIESRQIRNALIVSGENAAPLLESTINHLIAEPTEANFRNSLASLTLGSGAVAMLMTHSTLSTTKHYLVGGVSQVASEHHMLCQGSGDYRRPLMRTDSVRLMKEGISLAKKTWQIFTSELAWGAGDFEKILTHQVSQAHYEKVFQELGIDPQKGRKDCVTLGNTGSVAAPLSLALADENGELQHGNKVALLGIGSGLNTMMLGIQW